MEGTMRTAPFAACLAASGAALTLSACDVAATSDAPHRSPPPGLAYVCEGGETAHADYDGTRSAVVSWRDESWHMTATGKPGGYVAQNRQWQVSVHPGYEEGVLTALGAKPAVIARCRRGGELSPAAAALPPPGSARDCTAADLSLKFVGEDAGAGQRWDTIAVANRGLGVCAVQGFAEVALLADDDRPVRGVNVVQSLQAGPVSGPAERITLKPGARAVFYMHWTPIQSGAEACPHVARLKVVTPGGRTGLLPLNATPCGGQATISPLRREPSAAKPG
jgi:hypothetical protein